MGRVVDVTVSVFGVSFGSVTVAVGGIAVAIGERGEPVGDTGEAVNTGAQPISSSRLKMAARRACVEIDRSHCMALPLLRFLAFEQLLQFLLVILE